MKLVTATGHFAARIIRYLLDFWSALCFRCVYGSPKSLPPVTNNLVLHSAVSLAQKIRERQVTCVEVVEAFIQRTKEVQPIINAVVDDRYEDAIVEAYRVDNLIASGGKSTEELERETPFLGVPFSCKEHIGVKGMSFTCGLVSRKGIKAEDDAEVVKRLKSAGAIPIGSTNLPEFAFWWEAGNKLYGTTNNPYDTRRTCGGSSGGEGALIASAGSVIGVGSDIAGSIRLPAVMNGIFGHKPSPGVVPNAGAYPPTEDSLRKYEVIGPLCRYAVDLLPMMKVMTNDDLRLKLGSEVDLRQLKVYYAEESGDPWGTPVVSGVRTALHEVLHYLEEKHGVKPQKVHLKNLKRSFFLWRHLLIEAGLPPLKEDLGIGRTNLALVIECIKWCLRLSNHTVHALFNACIDEVFQLFEGQSTHRFALRTYAELENQFNDMLKENCVFLYPTQPEPAPFHCETIFKVSNLSYTTIFNILGFPSTQVPVGFYKGMPIGIQCAARMFNDRLTLAVAVDLEKRFGGWKSPAPVL